MSIDFFKYLHILQKIKFNTLIQNSRLPCSFFRKMMLNTPTYANNFDFIQFVRCRIGPDEYKYTLQLDDESFVVCNSWIYEFLGQAQCRPTRFQTGTVSSNQVSDMQMQATLVLWAIKRTSSKSTRRLRMLICTKFKAPTLFDVFR